MGYSYCDAFFLEDVDYSAVQFVRDVGQLKIMGFMLLFLLLFLLVLSRRVMFSGGVFWIAIPLQ